MKLFYRISFAAALAFLLAIGAQSANAQVPGPHPAYLHALSDLRAARAYLDKLGPDDHVDNLEGRAIREIDAAINEIKKASIDDGKDLRDHPAIDTHLRRTDRFHKAEELLRKVHDDLDRAEDVPAARGLRNRALHHVDEAWHTTQDAINSALQ